VNSGCVGINHRYAEFAKAWSLLMEQLAKDGADMKKNEELDWAGGILADRPERPQCNDHGDGYANRLAWIRSYGFVSVGKQGCPMNPKEWRSTIWRC